MKLYFYSTKDVPQLTTVECLNMLEEERHHTDFLDPLKKDIVNVIISYINRMLTFGRCSYFFDYENENPYFTKLTIFIKLNRCENDKYASNKNNNGFFYNSDILEDGKLKAPQLDINLGIDENNNFSEKFVNLIVDHEINHMYDDWQWQSSGHKPLTNEVEWNQGDGMFTQENLDNKQNRLLQSLAWSVYASLWTETNAYVNQAFKEFGFVKMNPGNVHQKIKSTTSYRNYSKQMIDLKWWVNKYPENELREIVKGLFAKYGRLSIPKPKPNEDYKDKLIKWSEGIYNKFMKRYCGIASLYLERNFQ